MKIQNLNRVFVVIGMSLLLPIAPSHANSQHLQAIDHRANGFIAVVRMGQAMGGYQKIRRLSGQRLVASGEQHEPEQSFYPGGESVHIANYQQVLLQAFDKRQSFSEWSVETLYPVPAQRQFSEIINGEHGAVVGVDSIIAPAQAPMRANRMGSRTKQYLLSSPLAIIHQAINNRRAVKFLGIQNIHNRPHRVIAIPALGHQLKLYINAATGLPTLVETLEDDSIYGDALWSVHYKDWQQTDGIKLPTRLVHRLNGRLIHTVNLSSIELLRKLDDSQFVIPEQLKIMFNQELFDWGVRSSQWFGRFLLTGIPFDLDQSTDASVTLVDIAPGITHVLGFTHNTMIVEMDDYLVAIDPPLYEKRTEAVLRAVTSRWPEKPIKYIVPSHFHNDHIGGIRGYAALGATLVVGNGTKSHYEQILASPRTVYPDTLSQQPVNSKIIEVSADEAFFIKDSQRSIRLLDVANRHSIGMLVPYVEDARLVFVSDLYNPDLFPAPIPALFSFWSLDLLEGLENSGLDIDWLVGAHGGVVSYERFVSDVEASF